MWFTFQNAPIDFGGVSGYTLTEGGKRRRGRRMGWVGGPKGEGAAQKSETMRRT
jgi:hypothetical protein